MNYDYDSPAQVINLIGVNIPNNKNELNLFIKNHKLQHGDIIRTTDFRELEAKIVFFNENEEIYDLVDNPDESDAGYLTVPLKVTKPIKSALKKYQTLHKEINHFDLFLAPTDEFIELTLKDLPQDARVLLLIDEGYISMALVFVGENSKSERTLENDEIRSLNQFAKNNGFL